MEVVLSWSEHIKCIKTGIGERTILLHYNAQRKTVLRSVNDKIRDTDNDIYRPHASVTLLCPTSKCNTSKYSKSTIASPSLEKLP